MSELPYPRRIDSLEDLAGLERLAQRHDVPCADGPMVWRRWGRGTPVVLLHGGSGSWNHWARNVGPLVAAGREVWVPDLPGFGDSAAPPGGGGDADALAQPLEDAMQALLGDAPVDLVAFSFGTMVAGFLAERHPARVRRLVLVGAAALGIQPAEPVVLRPWTHLPPGPALEAVLRENLAVLMLAQPSSIDEFALAMHVQNMLRDRMRQRRLARTDVLHRTLAHVRCPLHAIWGEQDVLVRGVQDRLAAGLSPAPDLRSLVLVPHAGHWVQFERADAFDRALAAALAQ